jgi:cellulose biosynthesis protein BcsQ
VKNVTLKFGRITCNVYLCGMSKILIFGNQKGGVGKSTITCLSANALANAPFNLKVCVIDNDKQSSISEARSFDAENYGDRPAPYDVLKMDIAELQKNIQELDEKYDIILIDTAGRLDAEAPIENQEITKALMYADYLFLPFKAGNFNLDATLQYLKFILQLQTQRQNGSRPLAAFGFVNMYRTRSKSNEFLVGEIKHLKEGGVNFMVNRLGHYAAFEEIDTYTSLYDEDTNNPARLNFTVWLNELVKLIAK